MPKGSRKGPTMPATTCMDFKLTRKPSDQCLTAGCFGLERRSCSLAGLLLRTHVAYYAGLLQPGSFCRNCLQHSLHIMMRMHL